jgi:general secretion pathway protein I
MSLRPNRPSQAKGFTLIEVLVALGIVAVALAAGIRTSAALTRNAERQTGLLLAQLCAENALVSVRLSKQMPAVGDNTTECEQAGRSLSVTLSVRATPNPNFLRVEAGVADQDTPLLALSTVIGRY